jgi:hypothetical protein
MTGKVIFHTMDNHRTHTVLKSFSFCVKKGVKNKLDQTCRVDQG